MNKKFANTTGWRVGAACGVFDGGKLIAAIYGDSYDCSVDETMIRRAHLISSAPELLEALQFLLDMADEHGDFRNGVTDPTGAIDEGNVRAAETFKMCRAAILKATGKTSEAA